MQKTPPQPLCPISPEVSFWYRPSQLLLKRIIPLQFGYKPLNYIRVSRMEAVVRVRPAFLGNKGVCAVLAHVEGKVRGLQAVVAQCYRCRVLYIKRRPPRPPLPPPKYLCGGLS